MLCWSFGMTQGILTIPLYCTIFVPSFALRRSGFGCVLSFNVSGLQSNLNFSESQLDQTGKFAFIPGCNLMGCDIFQIMRMLSLSSFSKHTWCRFQKKVNNLKIFKTQKLFCTCTLSLHILFWAILGWNLYFCYSDS